MSVAAILGPSIALVVLVITLLLRLAYLRVASIRRGVVKPRDIALGQKNWTEDAIKVGNCVDNQFQLPLLFHVLTGFVLATSKGDLLFVALGWAFVLARLVHAMIHITSNNVVTRFYAYAIGLLLLAVLWLLFAAKIIIGV